MKDEVVNREGTQSADYLFPKSAVMKRASSKTALVTDALPRSSGYSALLSRFQWSGRRSGEGIDAGIGRNADVILGGWSCCRSVNPVVKGCVTLESHSRTSVNCIQCGVTFDVLDNARAMAMGTPNCMYHSQEPVQSENPVGPFGDAVWPCCATVGFRNSKYHSEVPGRPSRYADRPVDAATWGCAQGYHQPSLPGLKQPLFRIASLQASPPHDLPPCDWICSIVDECEGDVARDSALGFAEDPVLSAPWRRLIRVHGVAASATQAQIRAACSQFGSVIAVYRKAEGRQCAPPPAVTTIRAKLPEATLLSNKFRSAAFTGEIPRDETGVPAPPTPQSASRLVTSRTMVSLTSKPPLWPPSTVTTQADDVWFVEFGTVKAAARFMSALSSPRVSESLRCLCTPSTVANFALQSTRCCVAAVASSGHLLWIPVDSVTSTATDIMSYLQLRTGCKGGDLTRRVHWAGTFPIAASTPVYQYCTRCPEHFRHMRDGAVDDKVKSACTYHPGLFCWQFRIRQILEAPNKAARVPQPTFVDIPPPPLPALATHTLETFLLPRPLPMLSCLTLREVPGPNLEDDLVPVAVRAVYGRKSHFKPTLPSPALMVSQTRPLGGFRAPLSKPVDMFREILRPAVAAPLWSWFIDSTPTLEPPLLLMPIHADVRRCVLPVTPSARRFYAKAKYDITIPPHHNNRVGLVWQSPVCASPLPRAKPPPSGPAPDPARFIVCDHQCVRRVFPTITVPVKNTGKREIVVTINEHFAEVDVALDFDRTLAYGYRLMLNEPEEKFVFPPGCITTVTLGAADPNFFSKTMMIPLSDMWKPSPLVAEGMLMPPRKVWKPHAPHGTLPAPGEPLAIVLPPPPARVNKLKASGQQQTPISYSPLPRKRGPVRTAVRLRSEDDDELKEAVAQLTLKRDEVAPLPSTPLDPHFVQAAMEKLALTAATPKSRPSSASSKASRPSSAGSRPKSARGGTRGEFVTPRLGGPIDAGPGATVSPFNMVPPILTTAFTFGPVDSSGFMSFSNTIRTPTPSGRFFGKAGLSPGSLPSSTPHGRPLSASRGSKRFDFGGVLIAETGGSKMAV